MAKPVPFDFILEEIETLKPYTKPMFGCTSVYVGERIVFILRKKDDDDPDNGVWLATTSEHHETLRGEFPSMRSIKVFGDGPTGWQVLPEDASDFEESVLRACELVRRLDPRIGKIPKSKLGKTKRTAAGKKSVMKPKKRKAVKRQAGSSRRRRSPTRSSRS